MVYRFEFRPYQRPFRQPLSTYHGLWKVREGIILRLSDNRGRSGFGEIAPLPWYGSETFEQALAFCEKLPSTLSEETLLSILPTLPACQFGFESMFADLAQDIHYAELPMSRYSALLPTGQASLIAWKDLWDKGHRTFKLKIGIDSWANEFVWVEALLKHLPLGAKLRLDANGGLDELTAHHWLDWCDHNGNRVEFIEQPLSPDQFAKLLKLSHRYQTPVALDESVATLEQLKMHYYKGWRGIYILKAAIVGSPNRLKQFCLNNPIDFVISSVFETNVGRQALIDLAMELETVVVQSSHRALGLGTQQWLPDDGLNNNNGHQANWELLWQQLA